MKVTLFDQVFHDELIKQLKPDFRDTQFAAIFVKQEIDASEAKKILGVLAVGTTFADC